MIHFIRFTFIFALLGAETGIHLALSQDLKKDSLTYYLEIAVKNNPKVLQRYTEYQAALQRVPQAGSLPDPELSVGVFLEPMALVNGNQVADIRLMQMFPWFGTLKSSKDEMSLMANASYESFRDAELGILFDVQRTWYELYKTEQEIRISEKNMVILKTIERLALVRFQASSPGVNGSSFSSTGSGNTIQTQLSSSGTSGMQNMQGGQITEAATGSGNAASMPANSMETSSGGSGLTDLYLIQIETGELGNRIASLQDQKTTLTATFNGFLNRHPESPVTLPDTIAPDTLGISLAFITDSMLLNNPMLTMIKFEEQSLDARKRMVSRKGFPMLGLGIDYSMINKSGMSVSNMNGRDMIMPMVSVTLPVYRRKYKAMRTETELLQTSARQNYSEVANGLQTEYYNAIQLYNDASRRMKLYSEQYGLVRKTFDILLQDFSASGSTLTDVLRVQQQMLDYELKKTGALADYNTAIAWLRRLSAMSQS
jgi:outer membrane protein TolC